MTPAQASGLSPMLIVAATAVAVMLATAFVRRHLLVAFLTVLGLATALLACVLSWDQDGGQLTGLVALDPYGRFFNAFFIVTTLLLVLLSYPYMQRHAAHREEYYLLLLLASLGAMGLAASTHFASLFLSLELLSISLYGMIAYRTDRASGIEAAMKYLIMASVSSGFLLFGMALIYAQYGTMQLGALARAVGNEAALLPGLVLILVGVGFKLALVPFHMWAPDVYQGAPAPVAGFITTISKAGMFALVLRFAEGLRLAQSEGLLTGLGVIAVVTMTAGNLLALQQPNLKRLLAYSSIAHMGYLLVTVLVSRLAGSSTGVFYLVTYFAAVLSAFGVIGVLSTEGDEPEDLRQYHGLAWRRPLLAAVLTAAMFSLAGLPLTAGFLGKFLIVTMGVARALWVPIFALVINSTIGLYYYLRVVATLYARREAEETTRPAVWPVAGAGVALALLVMVTLWLGVYPTPVLNVIQEAMAGLVR